MQQTDGPQDSSSEDDDDDDRSNDDDDDNDDKEDENEDEQGAEEEVRKCDHDMFLVPGWEFLKSLVHQGCALDVFHSWFP